jgi:hypothetical protein
MIHHNASRLGLAVYSKLIGKTPEDFGEAVQVTIQQVFPLTPDEHKADLYALLVESLLATGKFDLCAADCIVHSSRALNTSPIWLHQ